MLCFIQFLALLCFSSLTFASKPAPLTAAAAQSCTPESLKPCQVHSHAVLLAERKQLSTYLAQSHVNADSAQIIASYWATPQQWKLARELRLPGVSRVASIAEYAPDAIAVSYYDYLPANKDKKVVFTGNVRAEAQSNMEWKVSEKLQQAWFVATGKNNIIGSLFDGGTRLAFINVENGKERIVKPDEDYMLQRVTPIPDGLCAVVIDGEVIVIRDWTEQDKLVVENLGRMPNSITALDSLPGNRLAVGDCGGLVNVYYPNERCRGMFKVGDRVETIIGLTDDVMAISTWLQKKVPTNASIHGFPVERISSQSHIVECWHTPKKKNYQLLGRLFENVHYDEVTALSNSRIALLVREDTKSKRSSKLSIYTIEILKESNEPTGVKEHLEQEISFADDPISNWAVDSSNVPVFLPRASKPTMAIGTKSGAVKIFEEVECEQCCGGKKTNNDAACSAK